jgi:hypothetical protein
VDDHGNAWLSHITPDVVNSTRLVRLQFDVQEEGIAQHLVDVVSKAEPLLHAAAAAWRSALGAAMVPEHPRVPPAPAIGALPPLMDVGLERPVALDKVSVGVVRDAIKDLETRFGTNQSDAELDVRNALLARTSAPPLDGAKALVPLVSDQDVPALGVVAGDTMYHLEVDDAGQPFIVRAEAAPSEAPQAAHEPDEHPSIPLGCWRHQGYLIGQTPANGQRQTPTLSIYALIA